MLHSHLMEMRGNGEMRGNEGTFQFSLGRFFFLLSLLDR